MAVPSSILQHTDLREPLRKEVEIPDGSRSRERSRHSRRPRNLNIDSLSRRDRSIEWHLDYRSILRVPIVRRNKTNSRRQVRRRTIRTDSLEAGDVDPAPVRVLTIARRGIPATGSFAHPGRFVVAPRVVIQME